MKKTALLALLVVLGFSALSHAALYDNGQGLIYDSGLNITWYAYPNYETNTFEGYAVWIQNLNAGGQTGWRFPTTDVNSSGYVHGGEMGHLFYDELGNSEGQFTNAGPFANYGGLNSGFYTSTPAPQGNGNFWYFTFPGDGGGGPGSQEIVYIAYYYFWIHGLAVHDGNVGGSPVPIPGTLLLLGSSLLGLAVIRNKINS